MRRLIDWAKRNKRNTLLSVIIGIISICALVVGTVFAYPHIVKKDTRVDIAKISADFDSEISSAFEEDSKNVAAEDRQKAVVTSDRGIIHEFMYIFDENEKTTQ